MHYDHRIRGFYSLPNVKTRSAVGQRPGNRKPLVYVSGIHYPRVEIRWQRKTQKLLFKSDYNIGLSGFRNYSSTARRVFLFLKIYSVTDGTTAIRRDGGNQAI